MKMKCLSGASFIGRIEICLMFELLSRLIREKNREKIGWLFGGLVFSPIASAALCHSTTVR
jgi:hypothetical protein